MRRARGGLAAAAILTLLVAAPASWRPASPPMPGDSDHLARLLAQSRDLGALPAGQPLTMILALTDPTRDRVSGDLSEMYRQRAPGYLSFKTATEFAATYGPDAAGIAQLRERLTAWGMESDWSPGNPWLAVKGPAATMAARFGVRPHLYAPPGGGSFLASAVEPSVPPDLARWVRAVARPGSGHLRRTPAVPAGGLKPIDVLKAYDLEPLRQAGMDGKGERVVFYEIDWYEQKNLNLFTERFGLPQIEPKIAADRNDHTAGGETDMDLQLVHEIAPGADLVVYGNQDPFDMAAGLQLMSRIVDENRGAIVVVEIDGCEVSPGRTMAEAWQSVYEKGAQLGETFFVPSGDVGAFDCLLSDPTGVPSEKHLGSSFFTSPPGVTSVGGTRISVRQDGTFYRETAWEWPSLTAGGGGGLSHFFAMPDWQRAPGVQNQYSNGMREVPDVSADADTASGAAIVIGGKWATGGGTSQSGPIWCGLAALTNQYLKSKGLKGVGFMNPALYRLAAGSPAYPAFHDVTAGTNLYYPATPGYDMATGLGSPDGWNLARDLEQDQRAGS